MKSVKMSTTRWQVSLNKRTIVPFTRKQYKLSVRGMIIDFSDVMRNNGRIFPKIAHIVSDIGSEESKLWINSEPIGYCLRSVVVGYDTQLKCNIPVSDVESHKIDFSEYWSIVLGCVDEHGEHIGATGYCLLDLE